MNNLEFAEILKQSYPIETKLQVMMKDYTCFNKVMKLYKKVIDLGKKDIEQLEIYKQKYEEIELKIKDIVSKNSIIDSYIEQLNYCSNINGDNYGNLVLWSEELEKRSSDELKNIYEYKSKEINRQKKFINVFRYLRNFTLAFSILFLILRNYIFKDLMNLLANNTSKCCVVAVAVVELASYVYRKNKKEFEYIEINYTNNLNVINLLNININTILSESNCTSIEEYGDKLIDNTKKFEKLCKFEDDKNKNKEILRKLKENQINYNTKLFKVLSSLDVKMNGDLDISITEFNKKFKEYLDFKRKYDEFMYEFNNLWEEYKNKNKYYEKIILEIIPNY